MADNETFRNASLVITPFAFDDVDGVKYQRVKVAHGIDGAAADASGTDPLPVTEGGAYHYAAGVGAATVDVPVLGRLKRVSLLADTGTATLTIGGGDTITVPAGGAFDETIPGGAFGADVAMSGSVASYYVSWVL